MHVSKNKKKRKKEKEEEDYFIVNIHKAHFISLLVTHTHSPPTHMYFIREVKMVRED